MAALHMARVDNDLNSLARHQSAKPCLLRRPVQAVLESGSQHVISGGLFKHLECACHAPSLANTSAAASCSRMRPSTRGYLACFHRDVHAPPCDERSDANTYFSLVCCALLDADDTNQPLISGTSWNSST